MTSVFDISHIFIVFAPGAGGNFLAGILTSLVNNDYSDVHISPAGSSHTTISKLENDYLSMGRFIDTSFSTPQEKINYYKKRISDNLSEVTHPIVSWTHDTNNIPLYRTLFPNSKIIVITQNSPKEKLAVTFMHVLKNMLDDNVITAFSSEEFIQVRSFVKQMCIKPVLNILSEQQLDLVFSEPKYEAIVNYLYFQGMLNMYGLKHLVENVEQQMQPEMITFGISNKIYDMFENSKYNYCITLPYSYVVENNIPILLNVITTALSRELSETEKKFVGDNFTKYKSKQNLDILEDPIEHYRQLKQKTYDLVTLGIT